MNSVKIGWYRTKVQVSVQNKTTMTRVTTEAPATTTQFQSTPHLEQKHYVIFY